MKRNYIILTAVFIFLTSCLAAAFEDYTANVKITPYRVHVGDRVEVTITVSALDANSIQLESLPENYQGMAVSSSDTIEESDLLGAKILIKKYQLIPFSVGDFTIPSFPLEIIKADGSSSDGDTPSALIHVRSVSPSEEGPDDIKALKGVITIPEEEGMPLWFVITVIVLLVAMAVISIILILKARVPSSVKKLLQLTPAQRALQELQKLLGSGLLYGAGFKKYYSELAQVVRRYLGLRYHILSLEMTSSELCATMKETWINDEDLEAEQLADLLYTCDMVKFAKQHPDDTVGLNGADAAKEIVETTRNDLQSVKKDLATNKRSG